MCRIISYGEVMLRLTPPNYLMLEQTKELQRSFVGTGVNLLGSLARLGQETALISSVPPNSLGRTAVAHLRKLGISDRFVHFSGDHMGCFFVEKGYGHRPTQVTYQNRVNSSFCEAGKDSYDFETMVSGTDYVHICGINLSLTEATRESAFALGSQSLKQGKKLVFDFNYRVSLNKHNTLLEMRSYYERILESASIVFGSLRDLTDLMGFEPGSLLEVGTAFMEAYKVDYFVGTIRQGKSLQGFLLHQGQLILSKSIELQILDRIGGGDAYAAGILYGLMEGLGLQETVEFAMANAALAHSTFGDTPMTTVEQVRFFMEHPDVELIR